jgi:hypothetical protein
MTCGHRPELDHFHQMIVEVGLHKRDRRADVRGMTIELRIRKVCQI